MALLTCQVCDSQKKPIVGLHVVLECFNKIILTYEGFSLPNGTINAWIPVWDLSDSEKEPLPPVAVDCNDFLSCRLTYYLSPHLDSICGWPSVEVNVRILKHHDHAVRAAFGDMGYQVTTATHRCEQPPAMRLPQAGDAPLVSHLAQDASEQTEHGPLPQTPVANSSCKVDGDGLTNEPRRRGRPRKPKFKLVSKNPRPRGRPRKSNIPL